MSLSVVDTVHINMAYAVMTMLLGVLFLIINVEYNRFQ